MYIIFNLDNITLMKLNHNKEHYHNIKKNNMKLKE
jgi:hypothetical protein